MKKEQLIQFLESFAPKNLAMDWDNVGFLLGKREGEVKRVFITLDVDCRAVESAIGSDCDFILSHHPFLFKGIKAITEEEASGRKILSLTEHGISVFSMHTNFDAVNMGMADLLARTLGWKKEGVMEKSAVQSSDRIEGIGFYTTLEEEVTCQALSSYVKEVCGLPYVEFFDSGKRIRKVAVCPGSGRSFLSSIPKDVDAYISGDFGHHDAIDSMERGLSLINAGHYGLEHFFVSYMREVLSRQFQEIELVENSVHFPGQIV
jgi:dinuclear metal center protein, YbgI family